MFGWRNWEYGLDGTITPLMRVPFATNGPHLSTSHFFLFIFFSPLSSPSARAPGPPPCPAVLAGPGLLCGASRRGPPLRRWREPPPCPRPPPTPLPPPPPPR